MKGVRKALIGKYGHDIDIANSLPCITLQWVRMLIDCGLDLNNDDLVSLEYFVSNRDEFYKGLMDHHNIDCNTAKNIVLVVLFGGDPSYHLSDEMYPPLATMREDLLVVRSRVVDFQCTLPKYNPQFRRAISASGV